MEQRNFGDTDLKCSAVGFGTWEMGATQYGDIDITEAVRTVEMAVDHGITLFDTAEVYGPFTSEELLARGLGARRTDVVGGHQGRLRLPARRQCPWPCGGCRTGRLRGTRHGPRGAVPGSTSC